MEWQETLQRLIESFIVSLPQLFASVLVIIGFLNKIKGNTIHTGGDVKKIKSTLSEVKQSLLEEFNSTTTKIDRILNEKVNAFIENTDKKFTSTLSGMRLELSEYKNKLDESRKIITLLMKQNKAFTDVISLFISQDPNLIRSGIAHNVTSKLEEAANIVLEEPTLLLDDIKTLENALKELLMLGNEKIITSIMGTLGYEKKRKET